jgi:hypothetical protein
MKKVLIIAALLTAAVPVCEAQAGHGLFCWLTGGGHQKSYPGPPMDRPFPLGQVTDSFWETQETNAEAADFIFYEHEFRYDTQRHVETAELAPGAKRHLEQVALRLEHVPFPIVIEASEHEAHPDLSRARRQTIVEQLNRMGIVNADERVVVAPRFAEGRTAIEAERTYYNILFSGFQGGAGRRFGGYGGAYR